jgi:hypothetical protein
MAAAAAGMPAMMAMMASSPGLNRRSLVAQFASPAKQPARPAISTGSVRAVENR